MSRKSLSDHPKAKLEQLARKKGIPGWHSMRKDELVEALSSPKASATKRKASTVRAKSSVHSRAAKNGKHRRPAKPAARSPKRRTIAVTQRDLLAGGNGHAKDRIVMTVRDPYWLHAYWEVSRAAIGRAEAALGQEWHTARPILRLMDVSSEDTTSSSECHVRDIDIHPGINNWYIDVTEPKRSYRVDIGYVTRSERFFGIARSNVVRTPRLGSNDNGEGAGLPEDFRRLYETTGADGHAELRELFEERLGKQTVALAASHFGSGASGHQRQRKFWFQVDAELVVCGSTQPGSRVSLSGENVAVQADGSFTMRFKLPDSRQIIPATAKSPDGIEERTIVLAVERNTKSLEPMIHDGYE